MPLDNRQIQLDSEALQRLMLAQSNIAQVTSPSQEQSSNSSPSAKSPLAQAMLQIHSPNSSPDVGIGETVVLQMEEGRATLVAQPVGIVKNMASSNSDNDEVFEKKPDNHKSEVAKTTLHNVISNLITAHTLREEAEQIKINEKAKNEDAKTSPQSNKNTPVSSATVMSGSPGIKGGHSPGNQKSGELIVPRPGSAQSSGSMSSGNSPGPSLPVERKKSTSRPYKAPHPAFPIPSPTLDPLSKGMYNYNLPDRGLGALMATSQPSVPHAASPPTVGIQRFQSPISAAVTGQSGQILGFISPNWPGGRPMSQSPVSSDSRSSGSPLDLSSVKDISNTMNKVRQDRPKEVTVRAKQISDKSVLQQQIQQPPLNASLVVPTLPSKPVSPSIQKEAETGKVNGLGKNNNESVSRPPYVREMLYLFDRELEIISVAKNKWIVRNESELTELVKGQLGEDQIQIRLENKSGSSCETCQKDQHVNAMDKSENQKRQCETDSSDHRSKVTKLTNGDVHDSPDKAKEDEVDDTGESGKETQTVEMHGNTEQDLASAPEAIN